MNGMISKVDWLGISGVIGALGVIILGILVPILTSRNNRKEKEFERTLQRQDKELENKMLQHDKRLKKESDDFRQRMNYAYSLIYGYLWHLLYRVDADRVSIIQPHPNDDRKHISISFEVLNPTRDVSAQKQNFQFYKMSEWASAISKWVENHYIVYKDVADIKDIKIYPEAKRRGLKTVIFIRLTNHSDYWIGTLALDYTHNVPKNIDIIKCEANAIGILIADTLPIYEPIILNN